MNYSEYLIRAKRGACVIHMAGNPPTLTVVSSEGIPGAEVNGLVERVALRGLPNALGGYYTPAFEQEPAFTNDMLLISENWTALSDQRAVGVVHHEACHCFRESSRFGRFTDDSIAVIQGRILRGYTRYQFENGMGHDDQWFATVASSAGRMRNEYPDLFETGRAVVETSLLPDWDLEPMIAVDWDALRVNYWT